MNQSEAEEKFPHLSSFEEHIFQLLRPDSMTHIDELMERSDLSASELLFHLLNLELKGLIKQSPGKYFQRKL